jgi:hypothetical protein
VHDTLQWLASFWPWGIRAMWVALIFAALGIILQFIPTANRFSRWLYWAAGICFAFFVLCAIFYAIAK